MKRESQSNSQQQSSEGWQYLASGALAITGGIVAAATTIRREFHEDIKSIPEIKKLLDDTGRKLVKKWDETNITDLPESQRGAAKKSYLDGINSEKAARDSKLKAMLEKRGYRSSLVGGTLDRFHQLSHESRIAIITNVVLTAAVTLGGAYVFFNSRRANNQEAPETEKAPSR